MTGYFTNKGGPHKEKTGGVWHIAETIVEDLEDRETGVSKPYQRGRTDLATSVLSCRSVNTL